MAERATDDDGAIVLLEHINLNTDDPKASLTFFLDGLGLAQDPRMGESVDGKVHVNTTMWLNAGLSQLHMPITTRGASGPPTNVLNGRIHLDVPSLSEARARLAAVAPALARTRFGVDSEQVDSEGGEALLVTDPAGNLFVLRERDASARDTRCYHPGEPSWCLGIPLVEVACPPGTAPAIARYYQHYFGARAHAEAGVATVATGPAQRLRFYEDETVHAPALGADGRVVPGYHQQPHGLHVCVYLDRTHASALKRLAGDGLLWGNPRYRDLDHSLGATQFRCKDIVDPSQPGRVLFELEHEVRTTAHATSPFSHAQPYKLPPPRSETVPRLVSEVTDAYEKDFAAVRAAKEAIKEGWVPSAPPILA